MIRIRLFVLCTFWAASGAWAGTAELRAAATSLLASLDDSQRELTRYQLKDDARATWSNLPTLMAPPAGIFLRDLADAQRLHVHDMLRASLSSQGYGKSVAIMWLDDVLHREETQRLEEDPEAGGNPMRVAMAENRDSGLYALAIFGDPVDPQWGWKITGHHLALNITVDGDSIAFTPVFLGSNPRIIQTGPYAGWSALPMEGDRGVELMRSLSPEQEAAALLDDDVPQDVFEGPGRRASLKKFEGLSAKRLSASQLSLLQRLVVEYLQNAKPDSAGRMLDEIGDAGWDKLWFAWRGTVEIDGMFYYRIHGPSLLIEYNRQNENHDHAVVRDPTNDYGEDWLAHHYREFHPSMDEVMKDVQKRLNDQGE